MRTLSPPKDKENALTRAIVSLQTRIQKAIRKKNRSRQPENEPVAPALTSSEPYLVQAMACYPIAVGIAQYITRRDLLVLASSTPALSKILWSPVGSTEPSVDSALATRRPGKLVINFVEFERVISCIERLDARLLRLRLEQETVLTPREFCSEILDIRRQIEDLKCTGLFSTTHTSRPRSMLPPKASVPGVRKRSVSEPAKMGRMIYYDAPIEERGPTMVSAHDILTSVTAFPPYRSGQWEELSVLRLRALVNEMSDTYSTAANLFVIEYSHRRTLPYRFAISPRRCVCHDPFVYRCNHPGMHLGGASFPPEYLWKRQWWEPASKKWTLYIPPTNFKYELRALIGLGPDRWTRDMRDRVVQIMNYRINRREEPPGGETIDYQWQNLERYTSECEECGISAPNTRIVFKSLRNSIGELFKPHLLADDGFKADLAELERRVGTIECWGCNKVFCKVPHHPIPNL